MAGSRMTLRFMMAPGRSELRPYRRALYRDYRRLSAGIRETDDTPVAWGVTKRRRNVSHDPAAALFALTPAPPPPSATTNQLLPARKRIASPSSTTPPPGLSMVNVSNVPIVEDAARTAPPPPSTACT